jgi:hypothetical protein
MGVRGTGAAIDGTGLLVAVVDRTDSSVVTEVAVSVDACVAVRIKTGGAGSGLIETSGKGRARSASGDVISIVGIGTVIARSRSSTIGAELGRGNAVWRAHCSGSVPSPLVDAGRSGIPNEGGGWSESRRPFSSPELESESESEPEESESCTDSDFATLPPFSFCRHSVRARGHLACTSKWNTVRDLPTSPTGKRIIAFEDFYGGKTAEGIGYTASSRAKLKPDVVERWAGEWV